MSNDVFVVIEHLRGKVSDISFVMLAAAREISSATGGEVLAVLLGLDVENLGNNLAADRVLYMNSPELANFTSETYQQAVSSLFQERHPRLVLFGHTSIGMDIASLLSVSLELPLVSSCLTIFGENGTLKYTSQLYGGKIMAEGNLPETSALITMVPGAFNPEDGQSPTAPEILAVDPPQFEELRITVKD